MSESSFFAKHTHFKFTSFVIEERNYYKIINSFIQKKCIYEIVLIAYADSKSQSLTIFKKERNREKMREMERNCVVRSLNYSKSQCFKNERLE